MDLAPHEGAGAHLGRDLSPLHLVGTLPQEDPALAAVLGLAAAVVAFAASALAIGRRDLHAG